MYSREQISGLLSRYQHVVDLEAGQTHKIEDVKTTEQSLVVVLGLSDILFIQPNQDPANPNAGYWLFNLSGNNLQQDLGKTGTIKEIKSDTRPENQTPTMYLELGKIAILGRSTTPEMGFSNNVSRRHATITATPLNSLYIHDDNSTNGTRIYHSPISPIT